MLGRKQSLKGEMILADYGPEESLNENADIEWVNKVGEESWTTPIAHIYVLFMNLMNFFFLYLAMGSTDNANVCIAFIGLRVTEYTENL